MILESRSCNPFSAGLAGVDEDELDPCTFLTEGGCIGARDTAEIRIFDPGNNEVLFVSGNLEKGNIQAHKDNQSTL